MHQNVQLRKIRSTRAEPARIIASSENQTTSTSTTGTIPLSHTLHQVGTADDLIDELDERSADILSGLGTDLAKGTGVFLG